MRKITCRGRRVRWSEDVGTLLIVGFLAGCAPRDENYIDDAPVSPSSQPLFINTTVPKWADPIPVCFVAGSFTLSVQNIIRSYIMTTWARDANVDFFGWGTCPSPIPDGVVAVQVASLGPDVLG